MFSDKKLSYHMRHIYPLPTGRVTMTICIPSHVHVHITSHVHVTLTNHYWYKTFIQDPLRILATNVPELFPMYYRHGSDLHLYCVMSRRYSLIYISGRLFTHICFYFTLFYLRVPLGNLSLIPMCLIYFSCFSNRCLDGQCEAENTLTICITLRWVETLFKGG